VPPQRASSGETVVEEEVGVFRRRCLGNGNCVEQAPEYFQQSEEDGRVVPLRTSVAAADEAAVNGAIALCPVGAIVLRRLQHHG